MRIRVLEVLATLKRAGAERVAVELARGVDPRRFEVEIVSLFDAFPGGFEDELASAGIRARHLGKHEGFDWRMYPRLLATLREFRPAVVHTHSYVMRYTLPACLLAPPAAMVHTVHNMAEREVFRSGRVVHRLGFRVGALPVAISETIAGSFRRVYGFEPAAVIQNGIHVDRFYKPDARARWRAENGFSEDDGLIVSVARLDPQKNPVGLLEAFALGFKDQPRWLLLLAGEGKLEERARLRADALGITSRVRFLGVREDVPELLSACDIFALSSHWEGSPVSVMEAMAAGLPVAATAVGGTPELVEHGRTGLLCPGGDEAAMGRILGRLARNARLRSEFGGAARKRARRFSAAKMVAAYAALFEKAARR